MEHIRRRGFLREALTENALALTLDCQFGNRTLGCSQSCRRKVQNHSDCSSFIWNQPPPPVGSFPDLFLIPGILEMYQRCAPLRVSFIHCAGHFLDPLDQTLTFFMPGKWSWITQSRWPARCFFFFRFWNLCQLGIPIGPLRELFPAIVHLSVFLSSCLGGCLTFIFWALHWISKMSASVC